MLTCINVSLAAAAPAVAVAMSQSAGVSARILCPAPTRCSNVFNAQPEGVLLIQNLSPLSLYDHNNQWLLERTLTRAGSGSTEKNGQNHRGWGEEAWKPTLTTVIVCHRKRRCDTQYWWTAVFDSFLSRPVCLFVYLSLKKNLNRSECGQPEKQRRCRTPTKYVTMSLLVHCGNFSFVAICKYALCNVVFYFNMSVTKAVRTLKRKVLE